MDSMDNFRDRLEALEQQTKAMEAHTHTVERRLRRWRGMAGGLLVLGLLSWALPSGKAADAPRRGMADRMATMEKKLAAMDFDDAANEVVITGANLRIVNGLGATDTTNGVGNLIVGYNELRSADPSCPPSEPVCINTRTGSHNIVVGKEHSFSSFGGLLAGQRNGISGPFASVSGGIFNIASGQFASVSGGRGNTASGENSWASGGFNNTASGGGASVSGGIGNTASGGNSWASGESNTASGFAASVSGGSNNLASGLDSAVSGGQNNTASGDFSSVSGGLNRTAPGTDNWAAGALFSNQ